MANWQSSNEGGIEIRYLFLYPKLNNEFYIRINVYEEKKGRYVYSIYLCKTGTLNKIFLSGSKKRYKDIERVKSKSLKDAKKLFHGLYKQSAVESRLFF